MSDLNRPVIVVPDGLAARGEPACAVPEPSFAFRAVLEHVAAAYPEAELLFSLPRTTSAAARPSRKSHDATWKNGASRVWRRPSVHPSATSTHAATHRSSATTSTSAAAGRWPLGPTILVVAQPHAARAKLCFRREGYELARVDAVPFEIRPDEQLPPRLRYQHSRITHRLYELGAITRDAVHPGRR